MVEKKQIYTNYKSQNKWLGIIDYKSLTVIIIYTLLIFLFVKEINLSFKISVYLFTILVSPVFIILCFNTKDGSTIDILLIVITFFVKRKIYIDLKYIDNKKGLIYKKIE